MSNRTNIDDLQTEKINKLIWRYGLPAVVGTMVNALYNIIDRFFIGHGPGLGDDAMSGLGITLPVMLLIAAVGMLVGAGASSRISIFLGKGDRVTAEKIIGNAFLLSFILTGGAVILLYTFLTPALMQIGATARTYPYAHEFLIYFLPGAIFMTMCYGFNSMMRASGYPQKAMYTMFISVVANIILAPLFIFVLKWGIKGAAIATVISMFIGLCFVMQHFMSRNSTLKLRWKYIRLNKDIVKSIVSIGLSPFFIQVAAAAVVFLLIHNLEQYGGDLAIGAYTIANTLVMLIIMVIIGLTQGMQPIVGYNYGAKNYKRVREALSYTIKLAMGIGAIGFVLGVLLPDYLVHIFNPSEALAEQSVKALRIVTLMLPLVAFQIVVTNFFQSVGKAGKSIFLSLTRQFLILIPVLLILPNHFGINGVWASLPVADFISTIITGSLFLWQMKELKKMELEKQGNL